MKKAMLSFLLLGFFAFGLSLFSGCPVCKCRPVKPYFDFSEVALHSDATRIALEEPLIIEMESREMEFLATNGFGWSGFGSLYACSCTESGDDGAKYPIEEISITSDQDFNADFPAGNSLNDLFVLSFPSTASEYEIDEVLPYSHHLYDPLIFLLSERPDSINLAHTFTFNFRKSNGEVVSGTTDSIVWD